MDLVKAALLSAVPARTLSGDSERVLDRLAGIASGVTPRLVRTLRPGRMRRGQAEDAAVALLPATHGALEPDETAGKNLERLGGLHRARTDAPAGVRPWLRGSAARAWVFMVRFAPPTKVRQYISTLEPADLDRSRAHARYVIYELPAFARLVETRFGRGFAGFRLVAQFGPTNAEALAAAAVALGRFRPLARRFDLLIAGMEPFRERRDVLLAIGAEYERQHPDQRQAFRKAGLDGLLEAGVLRPLDGVDALLATAERLAVDG